MIRKLLVVFVAVLMPCVLLAQSMSDEQVVSFVKEQKEKGQSEQNIASQLMRKGVTSAQMQRIRRKYETQQERLGEVVHLDDNYFECYFDSALKRGSSGSPVFDGEKVVGILYGDREGKESSNKVLFLSASAIMKLLKGIGYKKQ